jgi:hypothetical protein
MTKNKFFELLTIVETKLAKKKKYTRMRRPIPAYIMYLLLQLSPKQNRPNSSLKKVKFVLKKDNGLRD